MSNYPPIPGLGGPTMLQVFTHPSLEGEETENYSRYVKIGQTQLQATVALLMFCKTPPLAAQQITAQADTLLSQPNIAKWAKHYKLDSSIRCLPNARQHILNNLEECYELCNTFYAYSGGIISQHGHNVFNTWIAQLLGSEDPTIPNLPDVKQEPMAETPLSGATPSHNQSNAPGGKTYTQYINEIGTQKRVHIEYESSSSGPPHAPSWTMLVKVNGAEKGRGRSSDKKQAKEAAAKEACANLGW